MTTDERMSTRTLVLKVLDVLPDDATIPEVIERLNFVHQVQLGLDDAAAGRTIPQDEVKRQVAEWFA